MLVPYTSTEKNIPSASTFRCSSSGLTQQESDNGLHKPHRWKACYFLWLQHLYRCGYKNQTFEERKNSSKLYMKLF